MEETDTPSASAVALKLPVFWTSQPDVWFSQAEAQFHIRNITADTTKYFYVVAALDQNTASQLLDVLRSPPAENKYQTLKQQLLQTFGLTRRHRAAKLLDIAGLGDRKPSMLLAEMRSLSDGHTSCMLFEEIFLRQMPDEIRLQLAQEDFSDLDAVAERADALWLAMRSHTGIHKVVKAPRPPRHNPDNASTNTSGYCFYHAKFGAQARKCRDPCAYPGKAVASQQ